MERLFVYGTLAPGRVNHHILEAIPGHWQSAALRGTLVEEGWGSALGCPGIVPSEDGDIVDGYVFSSDRLSEHWARIDAFEGKEYRRVVVSVELKHGEKAEAYVYALAQHSLTPKRAR